MLGQRLNDVTQPDLRLVASAKTDGHQAAAPRRIRRNQVIADAVAISVGLTTAVAIGSSVRPEQTSLEFALFAAVVGVTWLAAMAANKLYVARAVERPSEELRRLMTAGLVGVGAMIAVAFLQSELISRRWVAIVYLAVTAVLLIERRIARHVYDRLRASGRLNRRIAVIGTDTHAVRLFETLRYNPKLGYEPVGLIGNANSFQRAARGVLGTIDDTSELLREHRCVGALISLSSISETHVNRLTRELTDQGFHVALSTSLRDIDVTRMRPQRVDGRTLIYVEPTIRTGWRQYAKRAFDIGLSVIGLLISMPLIAVSAVLIKLESRGPVFFRQERIGRDGRPFRMIKLRTMYTDAEQRKAELVERNEADGPLFKMKDDPRITRVGRYLRKLSIDELPQFWNVLRGQMSVVGPRPALASEVREWDEELHDRLRVLPGITGLWQVSGRSGTTFEQYKRLDLYYVDNWSLVHDVRIVVKTFGVVVSGRGAG